MFRVIGRLCSTEYILSLAWCIVYSCFAGFASALMFLYAWKPSKEFHRAPDRHNDPKLFGDAASVNKHVGLLASVDANQ